MTYLCLVLDLSHSSLCMPVHLLGGHSIHVLEWSLLQLGAIPQIRPVAKVLGPELLVAHVGEAVQAQLHAGSVMPSDSSFTPFEIELGHGNRQMT